MSDNDQESDYCKRQFENSHQSEVEELLLESQKNAKEALDLSVKNAQLQTELASTREKVQMLMTALILIEEHWNGARNGAVCAVEDMRMMAREALERKP